MEQHTIQISDGDNLQELPEDRGVYESLQHEQVSLAVATNASEPRALSDSNRSSRDIKEHIPESRTQSTPVATHTFSGWLHHTITSTFSDIKQTLKSLFLFKTYREYLTSKRFSGVLKSSLAVLLCALLQLLPVTSDYLGPLSLLMTVPALLYDMNSTYGVALEYCALTIILSIIATVASGFALWTSFDHGWGLSFWMLFLILLFGWARASFQPKWTVALIIAKVTVVAVIMFGHRLPSFSLDFCYLVGLNMAIGSALCLVVSCVIFPSSSFSMLKKELRDTADTIQSASKLSTCLFVLEKENVEHIATLKAKIKTHTIRMNSLFGNAEKEIIFSNLDMKDYRYLIDCIQKMLVAVDGMLNTCLLSDDVLTRTPLVGESVGKLSDNVRDVQASLEYSLSRMRRGMCGEYLTSEKEEARTVHSNITDSKDFNYLDIERRLEECNEHVVVMIFGGEGADTWDDIFLLYFFLFSIHDLSDRVAQSLHYIERVQKKKRSLLWPATYRIDIDCVLSYVSSLFTFKKKEIHPEETWPSRVSASLRGILSSLLSPLLTDELRYGIKIALAVWFASLPEWITDWYPVWMSWRGEWAAITVTLIMTPAFGSSVLNAMFRVIGTLIGGTWAVIAFAIFELRPWGVFIMFFLFVWPCWDFAYSGRPKAKIGIIALLTYTVVIIAKYSNRNNPDYFSLYRLAYLRVIMISAGVVVMLIFDRFLWPVLVRSRLRALFCQSLHNMAHLFGRSTSFIVFNGSQEELNSLAALENQIRFSLMKCEGLILVAKSEPHLSGPLDVVAWKSMMTSLFKLLEKISYQRRSHERAWDPFIIKNFIRPLHVTRREMIAHISTCLWVIAEAVRSRTPLPDKLPDVSRVRRQLLDHHKSLPILQSKNEDWRKHGSDMIYYQAYALAHKEIVRELEQLILSAQLVVGKVDQVYPEFYKN
ncbi:hypothetical protein PROFUN_12632 [Planoprotostelium fungivorum]|uniref:Putative ER transporter 6TM N-terminal domain-containing protein n=1 Tax=Planoprotostelium fungivorum TaxID=1890364 RepID=A0A2P6N748_9EUKA|nr:hypothetical protein PROFUN_12632 [Planoprotostelium fungivorum]